MKRSRNATEASAAQHLRGPVRHSRVIATAVPTGCLQEVGLARALSYSVRHAASLIRDRGHFSFALTALEPLGLNSAISLVRITSPSHPCLQSATEHDLAWTDRRTLVSRRCIARCSDSVERPGGHRTETV